MKDAPPHIQSNASEQDNDALFSQIHTKFANFKKTIQNLLCFWMTKHQK
ncbi:hypothetical protein [Acetobacter ghanensis]|nr:hypothetical protein [Acetobacter ghanensis]